MSLSNNKVSASGAFDHKKIMHRDKDFCIHYFVFKTEKKAYG